MNENIREVPKSIRSLKKENIQLTPPELLFKDFNFDIEFPFADESEMDLPPIEEILNQKTTIETDTSVAKKNPTKKLPAIDSKKIDSKIKKKN